MDERDYRLLHIAAYAALFVIGMYAASFGPVFPFLADDLDISVDTAGLLLTALFFGSILASSSIAIALHGRDMRRLTTLGLVAMVAGVTTIGLAPNLWVALIGGAVLGAGDGLVIAALHILMAITSREPARAISRLNLWFAVGAFAGPLWAGGILQTTEERALVYGGIGVVAVIALVLMLLAEAPSHDVVAPREEKLALPGNPTAWFMGGVLFLYVGAEFGLGTWVSEYAKETTDASVFGAAVLTSGYWGALALGRVASTWYFSRQRDASILLLVSVGGAGISALVLALSTGNLAISAAAAFGAGFFLGPVWPTTVAIASSRGAVAGTTAATVTMGNAGGLALPWLQGKILVGAGPAQGVAVTAVLCALMFVAASVFRFRRETAG
ncbi:MAG: MFS transporter [Dehalococcoidia bacterium]